MQLRELRDVPAEFEDDLSTSVVILTGSAKAFSAGFDLKEILKKDLQDAGYAVLDLGTASATASVDYPDFGYKLAQAIAQDKSLPAGFEHYGLPPTFGYLGLLAAQFTYWYYELRDWWKE